MYSGFDWNLFLLCIDYDGGADMHTWFVHSSCICPSVRCVHLLGVGEGFPLCLGHVSLGLLLRLLPAALTAGGRVQGVLPGQSSLTDVQGAASQGTAASHSWQVSACMLRPPMARSQC